MREYEVKIGRMVHTMQLSGRDAERFGASEVKRKQETPAPRSRRSTKATKATAKSDVVGD